MKQTLSLLLHLTIVLSTLNAQSYNWEEQVITERYETLKGLAVANDSTATIVGYGNIMVQTTDAGETWQNTGIFENDDFDYQAISFYGDLGFAVAQTGYKVIDRPSGGSPDLYADSPVLKTTDGGETWELISVEHMGDGSDSTLHPSAAGNYTIKFTAVEVINDSTIYIGAYWKDVNGATHQNILKSSDTGSTWAPILADNGSNFFTSMFPYNDHLYITGNKTLYKVSLTNDSVTNLYPILDKDEDDKMFLWYPSLAGHELIFPTTADSIWITKDEGATFEAIPNVSKGYCVHKAGDNIVVCYSADHTKASSDGGATWSLISVGESLWNTKIVGDSLIALGKSNIYTMATSDIANSLFTWHKKTITEVSAKLKGIAHSGANTYIAGYSNLLLKSTDGAQTFSPMSIPSESDIIYASTDIEIADIAQSSDSVSIASTRRHKVTSKSYVSGFLFYTDDNWASVKVLDDTHVGEKYDTASANPYAEGCYGQDFYETACIDDTTFMCFVQWYDTASTEEKLTYGRVFKTIDAGATWDTLTTNLGASFITKIWANAEEVFIGGGNTLLRSLDGGASFSDLIPQLIALGASKPYIQDIIKQQDTLYIPTTSDSIFVSYDNGNTFETINGISGANSIVCIDKDSWLSLGRDSKTLYTNNAGSNWEACSAGTTLFKSGGIFNGDIIALAKSKIYKLPISSLDYRTAIDAPKCLSSEHCGFKLWQNNSVLNIEAEQTIQQSTIYNMHGQLIESIRSNATSISIDASRLARGIYIVNVQTASQSFAQRILIK